jgi:uncharacterized protein (DUF2141 family)
MKIVTTFLAVMTLSLLSCGLEDELDKAIIDISGEVSHDGNVVAGVLVLLVEGTTIADGFNLSNGSITDNSGRYSILGVEAGEYYLLAVDDSNGNLEFDAATDRLGFHGVNPQELDLEPDLITVADSDVENIDVISLYSL